MIKNVYNLHKLFMKSIISLYVLTNNLKIVVFFLQKTKNVHLLGTRSEISSFIKSGMRKGTNSFLKGTFRALSATSAAATDLY